MSVYLNHDLFVDPACACTHYSSDRLGDLSLLTDHSAHIIGSNMEMLNNYAFVIGLVTVNLNGGLILNQT